MLQRIGIAQALINDPEVVFMDEPMSGLDPIGRREVRDLLISLRKQGKTVFFSSHILSDVEALCDRAAILSRGRLIRYGSLEEMTGGRPASVEVVAVGMGPEAVGRLAASSDMVEHVAEAPNGVQIRLKDERGVDLVLALVREMKGKLVSVSPSRPSLEDVFIDTEQA
jgi:ABC-2 type transport system ATP-binding protein